MARVTDMGRRAQDTPRSCSSHDFAVCNGERTPGAPHTYFRLVGGHAMKLILLVVVLALVGCGVSERAPLRFQKRDYVVVALTGETVVVLNAAYGWGPNGDDWANWYQCRVGMGTERYPGGLLSPSEDILHIYAEAWFREWELRPKEKP